MAATEQAFTAQPGYFAGARVIASPFQFVSDDDTFLRVRTACAASGVVLAIQGRRIDERGELQAFTETHTPNADRTTKTQDLKLGGGALLNVTVFAVQGTPLVGQCYVMLQILRNTGTTAIVLGTLLAGYVTAVQALGFPGSPVASSIDGGGYPRFLNGTQPAAGVAITETVPTGARWELIGVAAQLTTSGAAGARQPFLSFTSGAVTSLSFYSPGNVAAGSSRAFDWAQGLSYATDFVTPAVYQGLPVGIMLRAADSFNIDRSGGAAGDQWGAPGYFVNEWLEVN